jgi:hypothetical protein
VGHGKEDHQELAVGNLRRIVFDLHGLGVAGEAHADDFVGGIFYVAAGIAGGGGFYAFDVFEYTLNAPEAAAGKDGGGFFGGGGEWGVDGGPGEERGVGRFCRAGTEGADGGPGEESDDEGDGDGAADVRAGHVDDPRC